MLDGVKNYDKSLETSATSSLSLGLLLVSSACRGPANAPSGDDDAPSGDVSPEGDDDDDDDDDDGDDDD
ncbi:MAG: hypothetical protein HC929_07685 [Leptolyngbyaceae cyanobacterium SM2_5_2]|nr:hypothetical protein [Leptolyngbyaceae cyanobacterium SM2_5_2]